MCEKDVLKASCNKQRDPRTKGKTRMLCAVFEWEFTLKIKQ